MAIDRVPKEQTISEWVGKGIKTVVCLMETPISRDGVIEKKLDFHHISLDELRPPNLKQIFVFLDIFKSAKKKDRLPLLVHCELATERSATMAAAYLISELSINVIEAIHRVRKLRPGSITMEAEKVLLELDSFLTGE